MQIRLSLLLCVLAAWPAQARQASPYIPIDHWSMPYLEHLIGAGIIADPDPLTRPFSRQAARQALAAAAVAGAPVRIRQLVEKLVREFPAPEAETTYYLEGSLGFRAKTYGRRDPLRPGGVGLGAVLASGDVSATFGHVLVTTSGVVDRQMDADPEYRGVFPGPVALRTTGHAAYQFEHGELFWGTLARNWGPGTLPGLFISDVPYSYDHFGLRLGTRLFSVDMIATPLDNMDLNNGLSSNRYLMAHRLNVYLPRLTVSVTETVLLYGPGRKFEIWFLNPLRSSWTAGDDENDERDTNTMLGLDIVFRPDRQTELYGSGLVDDFSGGGNGEPAAFGATLGVKRGMPDGSALDVFYTLVSSLAYRSSGMRPPDVHARRNVGLARNFSDYDRLTVRWSAVPHPSTLVQPEITLLRQGEGDFRAAFPDPALWPTFPLLHVGIVERTWRFAVTGSTNLNSRAQIDWDAGLHATRNPGNVGGTTATDFVGSIAVRLYGGLADFWWWLPSNW